MNLRRVILCLGCAALVGGPIWAFDEAPRPKPTTIAETIRVTQVRVPKMEIRKSTVAELVKWLRSPNNSFSRRLKFDVSEVEDRLGRSITYFAEDVTYLAIVAVLADRMDADVVISPGKVKLVPRKGGDGDAK